MSAFILLDEHLIRTLDLTKREIYVLSDRRGHDGYGPRCEVLDLLTRLSQKHRHFNADWRMNMLVSFVSRFKEYLQDRGCRFGTLI